MLRLLLLFIAFALPTIFSCSAFALAGDPPISGSNVILTLFICGFMGLIGQGARMVVGLKTLSVYKTGAEPDATDLNIAVFSLARLLVSLIIGFIAGVLTGLVYWKTSQDGLAAIKVDDFDSMMKFAIAGYIGTDIVESFTTKYFEPSSSMTLAGLTSGTGTGADRPVTAAAIKTQTAKIGVLSQKIDTISGQMTDLKIQGSSMALEPAGSPLDLAGQVSLAGLVAHSSEPLLGTLSSKYEVGNHGPGTVSSGVGDPGGVSYGSYQMTSKKNGGTVKAFVAQLPEDKKILFAGLTPGDAGFTTVWKELAQKDASGFFMAQHHFIELTHYQPVCGSVADKVAIADRSFALQNVVWSTAVQHGAGTPIVARVATTIDFGDDVSDSHEVDGQFIKGIYAERGRRRSDGRLVYFSSSSPDVQAGVAKRFVQEQQDALKMLASERLSKDGGTHADDVGV